MADNIEWIADTAKAWSDTTAWNGGVVPTVGDNAVFTGAHVGDCTNLASGTGNPDNMFVKPGYSGDIGTSGNNLDVDVTRLEWGGSGTAYITSTLDTVKCFGTGTATLTLTQSGDEEYVSVTNGTVNLFGTIETLIMSRGASGSLPIVVVDSTVTHGNEMYIDDGTLTLNSAPSVAVHQTGGLITATNAGTYGLLDIDGGRCNIVVTGNVTINQCGVKGTLDLSGVNGDLTFNGANIVKARGFLNTDNGSEPTLGVNSLFGVVSGGRLKQFGEYITVHKF